MGLPRLEVVLVLALAGCSGSHGKGGDATGTGVVASTATATATSTATATTPPASAPAALTCSGAGLAAYADRLASAVKTSCTNHGPGVVMQSNYPCMQTAINQVAPPHAADSYNIVSTLLATNYNYPYLECTYFVQAVTTGVCGTPIAPPDTTWQNYPLAYTFVNKQIPGYAWMSKAQGSVQVGDIMVYDRQTQDEPGHIMIVAEVKDATHVRMAEANEINPDGSPATQETGAVTNTRVGTLDDPRLSGWYRHQ